jgi:hypothetical protein
MAFENNFSGIANGFFHFESELVSIIEKNRKKRPTM